MMKATAEKVPEEPRATTDVKQSVQSSRSSKCLLEPTILQSQWGDFEVSIHTPPSLLKRDLKMVFPSTLPSDNILLVPTCQHSTIDLLGRSPEVAEQKDSLLVSFMSFSSHLASLLQSCGYWADYCDPASGLPMVAPDGNVVFPEVACFERLRKYKTSSAGGCRVIVHPEWGTSIYPATFFTNAPLEVLLKALKSL
mmetsp:Transcript_11808/g.13610  ORF Transcript_11808/g.13610 Transcript_11808/m.13610 type:complete len:196 (-) Transcript_11808:233-820(-)